MHRSVWHFPSRTAASATSTSRSGPDERRATTGPDVDRCSLPRAKCGFAAETLVLMPDGRSWPICTMRPGDRVLNGQGLASRVVGLERLLLNVRRLYGINDLEPFFTADHPFLTRRGWKSLDPATSRRGPIGLVVRMLREGDILLTARSGFPVAGASGKSYGVRAGTVPLARLYSKKVPEQEIFNLRLDGDQTYIANGFVVHTKGAVHCYPRAPLTLTRSS